MVKLGLGPAFHYAMLLKNYAILAIRPNSGQKGQC